MFSAIFLGYFFQAKHTPPSEEKRKSSKRENKTEDSSVNTSGNNSEELDLNKKPKKTLTDTIDDILSGFTSSDNSANGTDPLVGCIIGELKAMKTLLESTTGKPKTVELERTMYVTYWKRLKEIRSIVKKSKKKK